MEQEWRNWNPSSQQRTLDALNAANIEAWNPFYCVRERCDGQPHTVHRSTCERGIPHLWVLVGDAAVQCEECGTQDRLVDEWTFPHARTDQHPPEDTAWLIWAMIAGRGSGKTRSGSEWTHRFVEANSGCRFALIAPTGSDIRDTLVEGESGLLATARPGFRPDWEPSKKRLTWPNGSQAFGYSGEEPDRLRGPQFHAAWCDEPAHIPLIEPLWSNLMFGLRLGRQPRVCITTTPLPTKWMKETMNDPEARVVNASTYANIRNLPPQYARRILARFEGTRLGKQEIQGLLLEDVEGALWKTSMIDDHRVERAPELVRIVVSVDPAGTSGVRSDETGITVEGKGVDDDYYVLDDLSGKFSPNGWAAQVLHAYDKWDADAIVVEVTYGRDMVISTITGYCTSVGRTVPRIIAVDSRRGKTLRAEPIVGLYERGQVHHVGLLSTLEDQQTSWVPGQSSPDRLDALVHGLTDLSGSASVEAQIASPYTTTTATSDEEKLLALASTRRTA